MKTYVYCAFVILAGLCSCSKYGDADTLTFGKEQHSITGLMFDCLPPDNIELLFLMDGVAAGEDPYPYLWVDLYIDDMGYEIPSGTYILNSEIDEASIEFEDEGYEFTSFEMTVDNKGNSSYEFKFSGKTEDGNTVSGNYSGKPLMY